MYFNRSAALAAAIIVFASSPIHSASITLDFHLNVDPGSGSIAGAANVPPFAGMLIADDSEFGQQSVVPLSFSFQFFDRVISDGSSGLNYFNVDLGATGEILAVDIGYDVGFDLSLDSDNSNTLDFAYDYTNGGKGTGQFVDGVAPGTPPATAEVPLPASAILMLGGLFGLTALRRKR